MIPKNIKFLFSFTLMLFGLAYFAEAHQLTNFGMIEAMGLAGTSSMMLGSCISVASIQDDECGPNTGGIYELYVISRNDILTFPELKANSKVELDGEIVLKPGKAWAKWDFAEDTGEIAFKSEGEAGSQTFTQETGVYIPRMTPTIANIIANALNGKFVVAIVNPNELVNIGGTKIRPMKFDIDYKSGKKFNDKNGGEYKFAVGISHPPLYYTGQLPTVAAPVVPVV